VVDGADIRPRCGLGGCHGRLLAPRRVNRTGTSDNERAVSAGTGR
jgi:hypothetical protein